VWEIYVSSKAKVIVWGLLEGRLATRDICSKEGVMSTIHDMPYVSC